jgi:hypothetical protein
VEINGLLHYKEAGWHGMTNVNKLKSRSESSKYLSIDMSDFSIKASPAIEEQSN